MKRIMVVAAVMCAAAAGNAGADTKISLAIERDNLLPLVDPQPSVVVQPRVDMLAATTEHRHDRLWQAIDIAALAASTATLACDWGQTRRAATEHWAGGSNGTGRHEANPIMGATPSTRTVNVYFATTTALNVALWYALPKRYRSIIPVALAAAETIQVSNNIGSVSLCGL